MTTRTKLIAGVSMLVLAVSACGRGEGPPPLTTPVPQDERIRPPQDRPIQTETDRDRQIRMEREMELEAERIRDEMRSDIEILERPVYFGFDQYSLTFETRASVDRKIEIIKRNPRILGVRIIGHTDVRGSTEYNLTLGQRRAMAIRTYMVEQGVPADMIETTSFGKERPVAPGTTEADHALNRRAEFIITTSTMP